MTRCRPDMLKYQPIAKSVDLPAAGHILIKLEKKYPRGVFGFESKARNGYTTANGSSPFLSPKEYLQTLPMDPQKDNIGQQSYPGGVPMVRIDGGKIRRLRESKGLTQLYLSTVVGVTTDTISRWENRRYQSIKLENGEKLAQALETTLEEILEQHHAEDIHPPTDRERTAEKILPRPGRSRHLALLAVILLVLAAALPIFFLSLEPPRGSVTAERILPPHVPPGQTFPVLLRIHSAEPGSVSLIIKESIPSGCLALEGVPAITSLDRKDNALKWISRTEPDKSFHGYICQVTADVPLGEALIFNGTVTLKEGGGDQEIRGAASLSVAPFHWADTNRDNLIDDEEILAVYEQYSDMQELDFDRDLIDTIWAGAGYVWDGGKKLYLVQE